MATVVNPSKLTSFGTSQSGPLPGGYGIGGHQTRKVVGYVEDLAPYEFPLQTAIGKGEQYDQPTIEWLTGADVGHQSATAEAVDNSETDIDVTSGHGVKFQVNQTIAVYEKDAVGQPIFSTRELMWVTAVNTDTLTVIREVGGTTAGTFSSGALIEILASAVPEGEDFVTTANAYGTWYKNYFQLIQKGKKISEEGNVTPDMEFKNTPQIARLMKKAALEAKRELEKSIIQGGAQLGTNAAGGSKRPSMMSGINDFIVAGGHVTNLNGNVLSMDDIENEGATLWESISDDEIAKKLLMNMRTVRMLDGTFDRYRTDGGLNDKKISRVFESFETRFGVFEIVPTRFVPPGVIYGVNTDMLSLHAYKGMDWTEKEHSTDGAYLWRSIYGKFTLKCLAPEAMFKIHGFDNDLTNYGRKG